MKNVPARPVMNPSVRLMVPVLPSTNSSVPAQPMRPARVTTNDGMPKRVIHVPWNAPIAAPTRRAIATAAGPGMPIFVLSTAMIAAHRPLTMPTVRSISPSSRTKTTPTAMVPTAAICSARLTRFSGLKKAPWVAYQKRPQMIASPTMTGTWPRSPWVTRAR